MRVIPDTKSLELAILGNLEYRLSSVARPEELAEATHYVTISILSNLQYRLAKDEFSATAYDRFLSIAYAAMERLVERWILTQQIYHRERRKRVYYLSMEYLMGRSLENSLLSLGLMEEFRAAAKHLGLDFDALVELEHDAGLGNGGLGRLAACFMDSLATLGIPAHGYGIRYDYGLFNQRIENGQQIETPDGWLSLPYPWEIARPEYVFRVQFGGHTERRDGSDRTLPTIWRPADEVLAMPYDTPIPGYDSQTVNTLRLWTARSPEEFNLQYFNHGDYMAASEDQVMTENITKVLYPNDNVFVGRELRLKQEYFMVSASIQDIVRRFKIGRVEIDWSEFPGHAAIQLNDTHPALAIPELMRILVDDELVEWNHAWDITVRTFAYTNHTIMAEAMEEWPVALLESLLPRHMEIIYLINHFFLKEVSMCCPGDSDRLRRLSLIAEDGARRVRMAHLAVVGSHSVNGVSKLHTSLLERSILKEFHTCYSEKFSNKTNGITPRRWLYLANPCLSSLITETIGGTWIRDLSHIRGLEPFADDAAFRARWQEAQARCKERLVDLIENRLDMEVRPDSMFDVHVKRIHEYKRQLLFVLYIIASYLRIKDDPGGEHVPRTFIFSGKAAPGYHTAKLIIRLISSVADILNADRQTNQTLRVAFIPNYGVSLAELIIPAADLSEQISTAGYEASGTSNMKFTLNGALTIGTLDGANVEIREEVGDENIFIFGMTAEEVADLRRNGYEPSGYIAGNPYLQRALHLIECDFFSPGDFGLFRPLVEDLRTVDRYCLAADFASYVDCQDRVSEAFVDRERWARMSILNVARSARFSSDRTVADYANDIWQVSSMHEPG